MEYEILRPDIGLNKSGIIDEYRHSIVDKKIKQYNFGIFNHILTLFNINNEELETRNNLYNKVHKTIDTLLENNKIQTKFYNDRQSLVIDNKNKKKCDSILDNFNHLLKERYDIKIRYFGR